MLLGQTLIRFTQLGVKIFDLLAQPGKSFLGFVICGRPRLARGFMSVCARRSGAVICPAFVRGSYGRWP
jgi:hypothetical protein